MMQQLTKEYDDLKKELKAKREEVVLCSKKLKELKVEKRDMDVKRNRIRSKILIESGILLNAEWMEGDNPKPGYSNNPPFNCFLHGKNKDFEPIYNFIRKLFDLRKSSSSFNNICIYLDDNTNEYIRMDIGYFNYNPIKSIRICDWYNYAKFLSLFPIKVIPYDDAFFKLTAMVDSK